MRDNPRDYDMGIHRITGEPRRHTLGQLRNYGELLELSVKFLPGGEVHALSVPRDTMLEHLASNPRIEVRVESVESYLRLTLRAGGLSIGEICVDRDGRPVTKDDKGKHEGQRDTAAVL